MILQVSGHPDDDPIRETLRFSNGDVTSAREQVQGWIIKFLGLVSTLVIFASVSVTHAADSPLRFPFVYGSISVNTLPLWLAKEQGFLRKYNLDPQLVFIISGRAAQAMVAGEVDVQYNGASHVANAVISGADMTVLLSFQNKLNFPLVVRAAIKNGEDLKGKKIAIGTPAGTASIATYVALDYLGLNPRRDNIMLLGVGGIPERLGALTAGVVEATSVPPEFVQVAASQGHKVLVDLAKENVEFQSSGLVTTKKFMRANPQLIENVGRVLVEAVAYIHNPANKKAALQTIAKYLRQEQTGSLGKGLQDRH
ncbi:MAG TPA: ABC transporter substrate-binding protein [Chthoniobacterales bacterium]|nr:ABC transporter substrate-binding protein [Chthoniobacterales bacterium]